MSGLEKAIAIAGGQTALAKKLNLKQGHVSYWLTKGVPPKRAVQIEQALNGQVTRSELCPEIFT